MIDIYLAIPYTNYSDHEREWIFETANRIAAKYILQGNTVISPISHSHPIAKYDLIGKDFESWRKFNFELLNLCRELYVVCIDGWKKSTGIKAEIEFAKEHDIPIKYLSGMI